MSLTRFGDSGPEFGLASETVGYVQDFNQKRSFEKATAEDNEGTTVTAGYFNGRYEGSMTVIKSSGGTIEPVATAVAATIANLQTISKAIIFEVDRKAEQKGFAKYTYGYEAWDGISLA